MKILFFTSQTGGGHMTVAYALAEEFKKYGIECSLPDFFLEATKKPFYNFPKNYSLITQNFPLFWGFLWYFTNWKIWYHYLNKIVEFFTPHYLADFFEKYKDVKAIISLHPLLNHFPFECAQRFYKEIKFIIVGIELQKYHTGWFQKKADLIIYPFGKPYLKNFKKLKNLPPYFGIPLREEFDFSYNKEELKEIYGIEKNKKVVLILGGSEGWGKIETIVKKLYKERDYFLICVTGRNLELYNKLKNNFSEGKKIRIFSYYEKMAELFALSDVAILKAGSLSLSEAICSQVPILVYHYLYGQELGNIQFITKEKIGFYTPNIKELIFYLDQILLTDLGFQLKKNLAKFKAINGRKRIAQFIYRFLQEN
uniref:Glycosyl transferase family 28 C-terminal domain-containing protein n=1 Tax=candidate division WOR-3 bacterium TaxID=2052148 RepID=A0A7V3ZW69_UNCW3